MAEGWAKHLKLDEIESYSAGVNPGRLDSKAVEVMAEVGVDISSSRSKHIDSLSHIKFDYVITVCDNARKSCPVFPGEAKVIHKGFEDPPHLARGASSEDEILAFYRRVRDEIKSFVDSLPEALKDSQS